jgi:hypothetical protein
MAWRDSTINVRNTPDLPRELVRRCGVIASKHADAAGFQEIAELEDHIDLKVGMPSTRWWWNDAGGKEVPQAFRKSGWFPADDKMLPAWASPFMVDKVSSHIAGANPTRFASTSFMVRKFPGGGHAPFPIAEVDTHLVNGAFSTPGQRGEELREPRWHEGMSNLMEDIIEPILEVGTISIVLKGDFNAGVKHLKHYVPATKWLWTTGIDNIAVINAPRGMHIYPIKGGLSSTDNPSDHNQRTALLGMHRHPSQ